MMAEQHEKYAGNDFGDANDAPAIDVKPSREAIRPITRAPMANAIP